MPPYAYVIAFAFQVPPVRVPTEVKLDPTTVEFKEVPVRVWAFAVTVPDPPTSITVPFMVVLKAVELFAAFP